MKKAVKHNTIKGFSCLQPENVAGLERSPLEASLLIKWSDNCDELCSLSIKLSVSAAPSDDLIQGVACLPRDCGLLVDFVQSLEVLGETKSRFRTVVAVC